jgi:hypothetical protein
VPHAHGLPHPIEQLRLTSPCLNSRGKSGGFGEAGSSRSPSGRAGGRSMLAQCLRVAAARHARRCRESLNNALLKE